MVRKAVWSLVALAVMLALPSTTAAQVQSWQEVQVGDIETMKDKWIGLAGAFAESDYDWRPMEGVRSVREVMGLAITEANLFPSAWGAAPGPGAAQDFGAELARTAGLSQSDMIAALETSFDYMAGVVRDMDSEKPNGRCALLSMGARWKYTRTSRWPWPTCMSTSGSSSHMHARITSFRPGAWATDLIGALRPGW